MGIKNLKVILEQKCKSAINTRKLDSYKGMVFGIDISIFLYKYLYNNDDHLEGLTRLVLRLLKSNITPVFIFDGKPPKEKNGVLQVRKEKRNFMNIKKDLIKNCINFEKNDFDTFKQSVINYIESESPSYVIDDNELTELFEKTNDDLQKDSEKLNKRIIYVQTSHIESSKKLFDLFGIKYIHEQCEAESLLAVLCKKGIVDGCISEDTDILANGGFLFLRNFSPDRSTIDEYCLHGILDNLQFTYDKFVDMCILCGCDYTSKINGMGPISAYKLIEKYETIEGVIENNNNNNKFVIPENFNTEYIKARELFKFPVSDDIFNNINKNMKMTKPNSDELKVFLANTKLKEKYFKEIDKNLSKYYTNISSIHGFDGNKGTTKKITDFFK